MRKTFIEAGSGGKPKSGFFRSLPLMRKTFIEAATQDTTATAPTVASLPLMRKTFIEAKLAELEGTSVPGSLPLMRKTFIEAVRCAQYSPVSAAESLPLMRKTFIEARHPKTWTRKTKRRLFRLCGRLSLRRGRSACPLAAVGAESLPLMRKTFIEAMSFLPHRLWTRRVSSAYAEDFH